MAETKISLKLVIDEKRNRVLLAEVGKDFVDFLLEAFTLPVVTVARFLKNEDLAGSLQSLYNSIENLSDSFIQLGRSKDLVLRPKLVTSRDTGSLMPRVDHCAFLKLYRCLKSNCYCHGSRRDKSSKNASSSARRSTVSNAKFKVDKFDRTNNFGM
ncbi:uncharacterized protein LOC122318704 [Carya illinoinensis]|uniref:uncharacterized protein LOC122318704 n=1 Tax=Carya illinoinensis TaxID=32201 RepID=UPI001C723F79|nr:uncharacterized protein LOC122318704 [Carya illinoinensis]